MVSRDESRDWAKEKIAGLWTGLTTPFNEDGSIDEAGLRRNVERCLDLRLDGIGWGLLGEPWSLSHAERRRGLEIVIDQVRGRLPVYGYATDHSVVATIELADHARSAGADVVMINPPYEHAKTEGMIAEFFRFVSSRVDLGIILYNTPHSGFIMTPKFIEQLVRENTAICSLKDGQSDADRTIETQRLVGESIVVSNPFESHWFHSMTVVGLRVLLGASSLYLMQTPANRTIELYTNLVGAGKPADAKRAHDELEPIREIWQEIYRALWAENRHPYAAIKHWQECIGMAGGEPRLPSPALSPDEKRWLKEELTRVGLAR